MPKNSPTQRTLRELRRRGLLCAVAERFNRYAGPHGVRQDLFGWIDIVALDPRRGIVGIQACAGSGFAARIHKLLTERREAIASWLRCGGRAEVWGWRKVKRKRGGKAKTWCVKTRELTIDDVK